MAKFELKLRKRNISLDELIEDLKRVATELNTNSVTVVQYTDKGKFGVNTFLRKFGSWNNALEKASLEVVNRQNIPDEELFKNIAEVWQHLGRQPFGRDMEKSAGTSSISLGTYEGRFGTWNKALENFIKYIDGEEYLANTQDIETKKTKNTNANKSPRKINWRLRASILIRDNCICQMCGASPSKDSSVVMHVDHIKPWSKGGLTEIENLQTLCSICNIGKSDLD